MVAMNSSKVLISKFFLFCPWVRPVRDLARVLQVGDPGSGSGTSLLFREGVPRDIFRRRPLTVPVISGNAVADMDAEPTVAPVHQFFDELLVYLAFIFQNGGNFGAEDLFQFLGLAFWQAMEGAIGS